MSEIKELREKVKNLKVLFVDDDDALRAGTGDLLKKFFNTVILCKDGKEALDTFRALGDFDIVITDFLMPKINGVEMLKEIKKINPNIFSMIVTASRSLDDLENVSDGIIVKPVTFEEIVTLMKKVENLK
jgi:CheY-like chemotaxis protein